MDVRQWTFCTEHEVAAKGGSCELCNGDRNLIQVCSVEHRDQALTERDTLLSDNEGLHTSLGSCLETIKVLRARLDVVEAVDPHAECAACGHPRHRHIDRADLVADEPCDEDGCPCVEWTSEKAATLEG